MYLVKKNLLDNTFNDYFGRFPFFSHGYVTDSVFLNQTLAGKNNDFDAEIADYLSRFPETHHAEIFLYDMQGIPRGKRISAAQLTSLARGCFFPLSLYTTDLTGTPHTLSGTRPDEEPDRPCMPVPGTLRPSARDPHHTAQLLLTMKNDHDHGCELEPANILSTALARFHQRGFFPVIAPELEFYLEDVLQPELQETAFLSLDLSDRHAAFVSRLEETALLQKIPFSGISCEAESGQFEINFAHTSDVSACCEHLLAIKRIIHTAAEAIGLRANFMAKPHHSRAGSGMHFHISLCDEDGHNLFRSPAAEPNRMMRQCLSGLLECMPASLAIVAPSINSFRRLRKTSQEALFQGWTVNSRAAALRIPCSDEANRRIEYRLAGADANPWLVTATILAGMLYGIERSEKEGYEADLAHYPVLPLFQQEALRHFQDSDYLKTMLGKDFSSVWLDCRLAENAYFESRVSMAEFQLLLQ